MAKNGLGDSNCAAWAGSSVPTAARPGLVGVCHTGPVL